MPYPLYQHSIHIKTKFFKTVEIYVDKPVRHGRINLYLFNLKDPVEAELSVLTHRDS
jgi:hypothetical protein